MKFSPKKIAITVTCLSALVAVISVCLTLYFNHLANQRVLEKFEAGLQTANDEISKVSDDAMASESEPKDEVSDFEFDYEQATAIAPDEVVEDELEGEYVSITAVKDDAVIDEMLSDEKKILSVDLELGSIEDEQFGVGQVFSYKSFNLVDMNGEAYPRYDNKEQWIMKINPQETKKATLYWVVPNDVETAELQYISINDSALDEGTNTSENYYSFFIDPKENYASE